MIIIFRCVSVFAGHHYDISYFICFCTIMEWILFYLIALSVCSVHCIDYISCDKAQLCWGPIEQRKVVSPASTCLFGAATPPNTIQQKVAHWGKSSVPLIYAHKNCELAPKRWNIEWIAKAMSTRNCFERWALTDNKAFTCTSKEKSSSCYLDWKPEILLL